MHWRELVCACVLKYADYMYWLTSHEKHWLEALTYYVSVNKLFTPWCLEQWGKLKREVHNCKNYMSLAVNWSLNDLIYSQWQHEHADNDQVSFLQSWVSILACLHMPSSTNTKLRRMGMSVFGHESKRWTTDAAAWMCIKLLEYIVWEAWMSILNLVPNHQVEIEIFN